MGVSAALFLLATVFIPETDQKTMTFYPPDRGETAFVDLGDGTATLKVGSGETKPLSVIDESALRGYRLQAVCRKDASVVGGTGVSYVQSSDRFRAGTVSGEVYNVFIQLANGVKIHSLSYEKNDKMREDAFAEIQTGKISVEIDGSTAVISMERWLGGENDLWVGNIVVKTLKYGNPKYVNDATNTIFMVKDTLGTMSLGKWREWAKNLYNGNRGEDWSKYEASENIRMRRNHITFGDSTIGSGGLSYGAEIMYDTAMSNKMTIAVEGRIAVAIGREGQDYVTNGTEVIKFSGIDVGNNANHHNGYTDIDFVVSNVTDFAIENISLLVSENLDNSKRSFTEVDFEVTSVRENGFTIRARNLNKKTQFYTLVYDTKTPVFTVYGKAKAKGLSVTGMTETQSLRLAGQDDWTYDLSTTNGAVFASAQEPGTLRTVVMGSLTPAKGTEKTVLRLDGRIRCDEIVMPGDDGKDYRITVRGGVPVAEAIEE